MENIKLFHGEAVSSCCMKDIAKKSPNGKIQVGKKVETLPTDKKEKLFCPWDCSAYTISVNGRCTVCGGNTY